MRPGRTRVVALGHASNAVGTINDVAAAARWARAAGAWSVVDAVHSAPHTPLDVRAIGCDFLLCSAYKFFGPHVGLLFARRDATAQVEPLRLSTQTPEPPFIWETGTLNSEGMAGTIAAVDFIADLGERHMSVVEGDLLGDLKGRRRAVVAGMLAAHAYEQPLARWLRDELADIPGVTLYGPPRIPRGLPPSRSRSTGCRRVKPPACSASAASSSGTVTSTPRASSRCLGWPNEAA